MPMAAKKDSPRRTASRTWLLLVLGAPGITACDLVFEYPARNEESSATACANGQDDDLDGLVDCHDPGCTAQCLENTESRCANAVDDDLDGNIDCADRDCSAFCHETTAERCENGIDDDHDGNSDCGDIDCAPFCREETAARCTNGVDDDLDGHTDCKDPACAEFCQENDDAKCHDKKDDDGDDFVDCNDPDCASFCREDDEGSCSNGRDDDQNGTTDCHDAKCLPVCREDTLAKCSDGVDGDFDGKTDCHDPNCGMFCKEDDAARCADGADNDEDGKVDCADDGCRPFCPEKDAIACSNGEDDDLDQKTDCDDPDCDGFCPEENELECADGRDNDGDGLKDGADPRCWIGVAPVVTACSRRPAQTFRSGFETEDPWTVVGAAPGGSPLAGLPVDRPGRSDLAATVTASTSGPLVGGFWYTPRSAVAAPTIGGGWGGFELAFSARIVEHTMIDVALFPTAILQGTDAIPEDLDAKLLGVRIDARSEPAQIELDAGGKRVLAPFSIDGNAVCAFGATCKGRWIHVTVRESAGQLVAHVAGDPPEKDLHVARPGGDSVTLSNVVVQGIGATVPFSAGGAGIGAQYHPYIDDLQVTMAADEPCGPGVLAPQLPFGSAPYCSSLVKGLPFESGASVSVAKGPLGLCAIATEGARDAPATWFSAYRSSDGLAWTAAGQSGAGGNAGGAGEGGFFTVPGGSVAVGAGISPSEGTAPHRAVVAYQIGGGGVRYAVTKSDDCVAWDAPIDAFDSGPDAEAPSYLVDPGGGHTIVFTRGANDQTGRTLWRSTSTDGITFGEPELVMELPSSLFVGAPVSIGRLGATDIVATYPLLPSSGTPGIGVMIADDGSLKGWKHASDWPLLRPNGDGSRFDGAFLPSGSVAWIEGTSGVLLYGGRGGLYRLGNAENEKLPVSAGTAKLSSERTMGSGPGASSASSPVCGDGVCDEATETCAACEIDCECIGTTLLQERVDDPSRFAIQPASSTAGIAVDRGSERIMIGPASYQVGPWTAAVRSLDAPVDGDFDLETSLFLGGWASSCSFAVGLGRADLVAVNPFIAPGAYAVLRNSSLCADAPFAVYPSVSGNGLALDTPVECTGAELGVLGEQYRLTLRRRSGHLSVEARRGDGCVTASLGGETLAYDASLPPLDALVITTLQGGCSSWAVTLDDFVLRRIGDPNACPAGTTVCDDACVDLSSTPEHCGACDTRCLQGTICQAGECVEDPACSGICGGRCVNLSEDPVNCGSCAHSCFNPCCGPPGTPPSPLACTNGTCEKACAAELCLGQCIDTTKDRFNCGGCGISCQSAEQCVDGACQCLVETCAGQCVDTASNLQHCGGCGKACGAKEFCSAGVCTASPTTGGENCGSATTIPPEGGSFPVDLTNHLFDYPQCAPASADVVFVWVPPKEGTAVVSLHSTGEPPASIALFLDSKCDHFLQCSTTKPTDVKLYQVVMPGAPMYIVIGGFVPSSLTLTVTPP
jgi:hypothetical protein